MLRKSIALLFAAIFITASLRAQNIVSVNPSTGTANVVIPIFSVSSGQITVPISISYSATGVKTRDLEGTSGMGWNLNCGGSINRVVRGLPDDVTQDSTGATVLGWMSSSNTGATEGSRYTIQNNGSTCSYGQNDIDTINAKMTYTYDTEPDIFYVNAPGLSCEMIYDKVTGVFHPVNYQDMTISYSYVGGSGHNQNQILSFKITNDRGWVYNFRAPEHVVQKTITSGGTPQYFTTKYNQYKNNITYFDSWGLINITDPNGNAVDFTYGTGLTRSSTDSVNLYLAGATTRSFQYSVLQTVIPQFLTGVSTSNANGTKSRLIIGFNSPGEISETGQTIVTDIVGMGHEFMFNYTPISYANHYTRAFLTSFTDAGCATPVYYQFTYTGVNTTNNTTILPDSTSTQVDYWGYYASSASHTTRQPYLFVNPYNTSEPRYLVNASGTPGAAYSYYVGTSHRAVSATDIADGTLSKITYAQGGSTTLVYEPNNYFDYTITANVNGGGLRIKQITDSAGNGATNRIIRNYTYTIPTGQTHAGYSSGAPVTLPQFGFTIPYSGSGTGQTLWTDASAQSDYDLSPDDHTILYAYSKVSETGAGSTVYNNTTPGNFWQANAAPACGGCTTEWHPTVNYAASYTCPSTNGPIANLTYSYPFSPNPNFDFEQGLPISVINYNDAGTPVSESAYTYSRSYTPDSIKVFKSDDGPTGSVAKFYSQYKLYYNTSELTASVTKTVYDSQTLSHAQSTTVNYYYTSTHHKLLTQTVATNSDASMVKTYFTYVKDYMANTNSNVNINALYYLGTLNENLPVETYQTITRSGATVTANASLTLFSASTNGAVTNYLPSQQFKLVQPNGESTFTPFYITPLSFTTTKDGGYFGVANFDQYDNTAYPETVDDNYKHIVSSFFDPLSNHPTVVFKNANYNEVAFNDFDSQLAPSVNTFTISGSGSFTPVGSHAGNAAGMAATQTITSGTITKNTTAVNYIFSFWMSNSSSTQLTFSSTSLGTITYPAAGWTYHEYQVPASSLGSTFTMGFTTNANISVDDILLYPDVAETTTATYDQTGYFKICQTNTNGVSAYFTNDQWGRVQYAYDQDHNIVQRNQYVSQYDFQSFLKPNIVGPTTMYAGISNNFANTSATSCYQNGLFYIWNFGDSTTPDTLTSTIGVSHTYADTGTYMMTCSVNSPLLGVKIDTLSIRVTNLPYTNITYANTCTPGGHIPSLILSVKFTPVVSGTSYTFSTTQLQAGVTVIPNNYTIQIYPEGTQYNASTNPTGWGSIIYTGGTTQCWNFTSTTPISFTDNLTYEESAGFEITPASCSP